MNRVTKADLYRYGGLTGFKGFVKGWFISGFRYTFLLRKSIQYKRVILLGFCCRVLKRLFGYKEFQISNEAQIGEGFYIYHRGTVIIGPVKIGKNCTVGHSVTIGRSYKRGKIGRPTLKDNVWIGSGAVIVGEINIGNDVLIAPNAFVNFNVPDNSLVIGNPGEIIWKENPTKYYIDYILD
jgi:serine O-acetyltransferase